MQCHQGLKYSVWHMMGTLLLPPTVGPLQRRGRPNHGAKHASGGTPDTTATTTPGTATLPTTTSPLKSTGSQGETRLASVEDQRTYLGKLTSAQAQPGSDNKTHPGQSPHRYLHVFWELFRIGVHKQKIIQIVHQNDVREQESLQHPSEGGLANVRATSTQMEPGSDPPSGLGSKPLAKISGPTLLAKGSEGVVTRSGLWAVGSRLPISLQTMLCTFP